jgi:hypothetical protein
MLLSALHSQPNPLKIPGKSKRLRHSKNVLIFQRVKPVRSDRLILIARKCNVEVTSFAIAIDADIPEIYVHSGSISTMSVAFMMAIIGSRICLA